MRKQDTINLTTSTNTKQLRSGFTIVELLIVVVVIAILAAITIVSYNGISGRAKNTAAVANLSNVYDQLGVHQVLNATYPVANDCSVSPAVNTICFAPVSDTSYQYTVDNTVSPPTFCVTSWNGTKNYRIDQDTSLAVVGTCTGHVANGATAPTITNLAVNPSLNSNATAWNSAGAISSVARVSIADLPGFTWAYSGNATASGGRMCMGDNNNILTSGQTYAVTMWAKGPAGGQIAWQVTDAPGATYGSITNIGTATGGWQKVQYTFVPTAATIRVCLRMVGSSNFGNIYITGLMVTNGSTNYNYADGNTSGWAWSGTANNSTSSGPNTGL